MPIELDEQARDIVARDVPHYRAAEFQQLAATIDQLRAEHEVTNSAIGRPKGNAARAGQAGSNTTTNGCVGAEVRRLERQSI